MGMRTLSAASLLMGLSACGGMDADAPSDAQVTALVRGAFLSQTYSNTLFGTDAQPCSTHFEVLGVDTVDRRPGEMSGVKFATVAVAIRVRAKAEFPYTYSCAWGTRSDSGMQGHWQAGEVRVLSKTIDFIRWESGWRLGG